MKYLIAILLFSGLVYSQCNKDNWKDYYNSDGRDMRGCDLEDANLRGADLSGANLRDASLYKANLSSTDLSSAVLPDQNAP